MDNSSTYNATSFEVSTSNINTTRGVTGKITSTALPSFVNQSATFTSSNPSVIAVDSNGNWTAIAAGTATITATSISNSGLAKTIPVTITDSAADIARTSVNDLFINNNPANHIKDSTNQAAIDAAQAKVNLVTDPTQKAALQSDVTKAQNELNARNEEAAREAAARASVNDLFINNNPANHIKDSTNQAAVDAAQAKVNLVTDPTQKAALQADVTKAQNELNARNAEAANQAAATASVNDLFIGNNPANHIKDTTNQAAIDTAQAKVNLVTDPTKKAELQGQVDKAKAELAARNAVDAATTTVNNLFSNAPTNTALKDSTTQAMIDAASAQVNALPVSADKTKLQGDVTTANTLFNQIVQTTISALTTESTTVSGKGEPNATITLKNGSTTIATGKVGSDGNYTFTINKQAGNTTVTATVTKVSNGKISSASTVVQDETIAATTIGTLTTDSISVSGKGEPNGDIIIKNGNVTIASGKVASDGNYLFFIPKQAGGSTITATVTKPSNGKISTASTTIADDTIVQTTISAVTADSTSVSGKGEPNAAVVIKNGTTTIASGTVDSGGNYYFNIAKQAAGSTITATVTKASNGKTSSASSTIADDTIVQTTISALTADSTSVSGKGEPNAAVVIKNGATTIASGTIDSGGNYYFNIAKQAAGSTITATVTKASNGKTSSASSTIADDTIVQTTISALTADSTSVSGKGEPNGDILIKNGNVTIASGKVASDGNYLFFIPKQVAGSTITATVTKASNGKTSSASTKIADETIVQTTIGTLTTDSTTVSGMAEPNSAIVIKNGSTTIASGTVASNGTYQLTIAKQAAGSVITATATKTSNGKTSSASTTIADDAIAQTTVGTLNADSTTVSGVAEPNSAIVIKNGSTTIASGTVASNGTYQLTIAKQAAGSVIIATATKASNGKTSSASTTVAAVTVDYSLKANSYKIGTANLTGTYGKNISKVRLFVNGTLIVQATTSNGTFTFANIASYITKPTDKVEVVGVDGAYVERARVAVTVTGDPVYDYSLSANDYTLGNATLTGKYGKDVSKVRLWVNNVVVAQATTNADGTYSFDKVPSFVKLATDKVEVVGVNAAYNEVARKTVATKGTSILDTSITPNSYAKDSANLTGIYGKDIAKLRLWVNGVVVAQASTSGTNFTFTNIASFIKNKTDLVEVVGVDAQYKELNRKTVTLTGFDTLDNSLTAPADFTLTKDTAINGTFGTNIAKVRLSVNGAIVKQAGTTGNAYTLAGVDAFIKNTSDVVEVVGVDAQYKEVARKAVTVKADSTVYDYTVNVNPYTFGDATITGAYGKDVTAVRLWVNGAVIKTAGLNNGTFTMSGLANITSPTDLVEIVAVNASFKEVARIAVQPK